MHTFIHFWTSHVPDVPDIATAYINTYGKVRDYPTGTCLLRPGDWWPYWNFVLTGTVMAQHYDAEGKIEVPWIAMRHGYFTGTVHAFTERREAVYIFCLEDVRVLQLPIHRLQEAQGLYHSVSEFINILKQRKIDQDAQLQTVLRLRQGESRFAAFLDAFAPLASRLEVKAVCAILQISPSTYYRGQQRYYRGR